MMARTAPSIFCSRQPFETINATQSWEAIRDLRASSIDDTAVSGFNRGFKRMIEIRNQATHSELFIEPDELLAIADEVLARFLTVMKEVHPISDGSESAGKASGRLECPIVKGSVTPKPIPFNGIAEPLPLTPPRHG
jgi:hypothetical protein